MIVNNTNKLTDYMVVNQDGEIVQYLTTQEKSYLDNRYTSANPTNSKTNDTDCRKNSD